jgi:hypothetical protein
MAVPHDEKTFKAILAKSHIKRHKQKSKTFWWWLKKMWLSYLAEKFLSLPDYFRVN